MDNKKIFSSLMIVAIVMATLVYIVWAGENNSPMMQSTLRDWAPMSGMNVSNNVSIATIGSRNLSIVLYQGVGEGNETIVNVSIMWQPSSSAYAQKYSSYVAGSYSFVLNVTYNNGSANNTQFGYNMRNGSLNGSRESVPIFDFNSLPDGVYNLTVMMWNSTNANYSGGSSDHGGPYVNQSYAVDIIVDNTRPVLTARALTPVVNGLYYNITTTGPAKAAINITFNVSIRDMTLMRPAATSDCGLVLLQFDNTSASTRSGGVGHAAFNLSADGDSGCPANQSGHWSLQYNISALAAGVHTVTIHVNDSANNSNRTTTWSFTVNTPANVTWNYTYGAMDVANPMGKTYNLTSYAGGALDGQNLVPFNVSIINHTRFAPHGVIFEFSNASGNDFNLTNGSTAKSNGAFQVWNVTYNVSELQVGTHTVKIYTNDTIGNWNNTETITFTVANTPHNVTWNDTYGAAPYPVYPAGRAFNLTSYAGTGIGQIYFNVSVYNVSWPSGRATADIPVTSVVFEFSNASGNNFNISYGNGVSADHTILGRWWNISYNVSQLQVGDHTVRAYVNDSRGNNNNTETISFSVANTPHNVTWDDTYGGTPYPSHPNRQNYSARNTTTYFNVSVYNVSWPSGRATAAIPVTSVVFAFDNASGNDFNISYGNGVSAHHTKSGRWWNISYNVSALTEGYHTVKVYVNDSRGNTNNTEWINFTVDKTNPSITVSCSPSTPTSGQTVTCTCTSSDSLAGIRVAAKFRGGTDSESTTVTASGSSSTCVAVDHAGNEGSGTGSWTLSTTDDGAGGASGSGGGSSSGVSGQFEKKTWTSILAGETASVEVDNGLVGITEVSFAVEDTAYGAWVQVKKVDSLPSSVGSFARKVYRNVEITENKIEEAMKDKATIKFKVEKSWLVNEKLKKDDVALFRYADDKWNELPTEVGADDGTYIYYEAESTGFSYFIIGEKAEKVAVPEDEAEEEGEVAPPVAADEGTAAEGEAGAEVEIGGKRGILVWLIPLVVVVVIIGLVYYFWRRE